jgi:ubiquinone/menaquinone biosynthesis C-methylase UbiE
VSPRRDRKAASRDYFDRRAPTYETGRKWQRLREPQAVTMAELALKADDRLLDVGCGTGAAVREAAPLVARAVGVDLAPKMIERARKLAQDLENVELLVGDSEHLPFAEGEFTAVLCTSSLHHYPHPAQAVEEMARVLAPAGRLAVGDVNSDHLVMKVIDRLGRVLERGHVGMRTSAEIRGYIDRAGLELLDQRRLWSGHFTITLARK